MPTGQQTSPTQRYGVTITTVDPSQGICEVVFKTGDARQIGVYTTPPAFRWPQVGESWIVKQINGTYYLDEFWPNPGAAEDFQDVNPGDLVLDSPTGVVHVMTGTTDDFDLTQTGILKATGQATFTADGTSNSVTVDLTHNLGQVPNCIIATALNWSGYMCATSTYDATTATLAAVNGTGNFVADTYSYFFYVSL